MASKKSLEIIRQDVDRWNKYRQEKHRMMPNLKKADLQNANLREANLWWVKLKEANLRDADLSKSRLELADLRGADLSNAQLEKSNLLKARFQEAILKGANLRNANLREADLSNADLCGADLSGADLTRAKLVETKLEEATLERCRVYGISAWNLEGLPKNQSNLVITRENESEITVDDLEVAQFIYLLLNRKKLKNVINTITSKAVLILGKFIDDRKKVLIAIADELRIHNLLPIIFDFKSPIDRNFTETIKTLAGMSFFVIADITNPKSAPLELQAVVPDYRVPLVPIIQKGEKPFEMFRDLASLDWVLQPLEYSSSLEDLQRSIKTAIIDRAWKKHLELTKSKAAEVEMLSVDDFLKRKNQT